MTTREGRRRPYIAFYSHDGFGLGHLSRTLYLASQVRQLEPESDIHIITSSPAAHRVRELDDFAWVKLPSVTKTGVESYRPHRLSADLDSVITLRSTLLGSILQHLQPDLLVIDHRPLGLKREALPALQWLRDWSPHTRIVAGLRDVVDDLRTVRYDWHIQGVYEALENLFDYVLVYGDRSVLDSTQAYAMPEAVRRRTFFVGYLGRGPARKSRDVVRHSLGLTKERLVVVHAGGGGDGARLIETYLDAVRLLPSDVYSLVVAGPLMEPADQHRLHAKISKERVTFTDYQDDLASYVAAADLSVSMGGYNTVCEVLSAGVPSLVIPRIFPRKEQYIRAQRLESRGLLRLILPDSLCPDALSTAAARALERPHSASSPVRLDGGARAARFLHSLLFDRDSTRIAASAGSQG